MMTIRAVPVYLFLLCVFAAVSVAGCSSGALTSARTDAGGARAQNLDHSTATIGLDTWTINSPSDINVRSSALDRGTESLGSSPATNTELALGELRLLYNADQDSAARGIEVDLIDGSTIRVAEWSSTGSTVIAEQTKRYAEYVTRAVSLDGAALDAYLAYVELVEGPAVRGVIESIQALGSQGLSILPDLLGDGGSVEAPSLPDVPEIPTEPPPAAGDGG